MDKSDLFTLAAIYQWTPQLFFDDNDGFNFSAVKTKEQNIDEFRLPTQTVAISAYNYLLPRMCAFFWSKSWSQNIHAI